jgi:hypothetical protein
MNILTVLLCKWQSTFVLHEMWAISWLAEEQAAFQERIFSMSYLVKTDWTHTKFVQSFSYRLYHSIGVYILADGLWWPRLAECGLVTSGSCNTLHVLLQLKPHHRCADCAVMPPTIPLLTFTRGDSASCCAFTSVLFPGTSWRMGWFSASWTGCFTSSTGLQWEQPLYELQEASNRLEPHSHDMQLTLSLCSAHSSP